MPSSMSLPAWAKMPLSGAMNPTLIVSAAAPAAGAPLSVPSARASAVSADLADAPASSLSHARLS